MCDALRRDGGGFMQLTLLLLSSYRWCSLFNADLALSVTMTAISTMLSTIFLPLNLVLYCRFSYGGDILASLDWPSLFLALLIVIAAISLGIFCSAKVHSHKFNLQCNRLGNFAGIALVIFSGIMSNTDADAQIWERPWKFYVGTAMPCLAGLLVANVTTTILRLRKPERV
jgi:sodium/bile acid cotransporter 2